ncbi:hypothetical protein KEM48_011128 [Puccinia striiformis f. sp. tritici PST-130]|nr:hypothetical protein KEM48_011128 [Puccinia striiformis f. sp. tritici PST-130]
MSSEKDLVEDPASLVKDSELAPPVNNHSLSLLNLNLNLPPPHHSLSQTTTRPGYHYSLQRRNYLNQIRPTNNLSMPSSDLLAQSTPGLHSNLMGSSLRYSPNQDAAIFTTCMLAIIPLAKLLGFGTEEIAMRVGQTLGGLLNATLGNAVELIVAILALVKCELVVVQSSLLGSILSNLLLVLGMCFFAGGVRFSEQAFSITAAQLNSSLLIMSVIAILIPAGFHAAFSNLNDSVEGPDVLKMSRGISVILLVIYAAYLVFQLWSHAHIYSQTSTSSQEHQGHTTWTGHKILRPSNSVRAQQAFNMVRNSAEGSSHPEPIEEEEEEEEVPTLNPISAIILLALSTALVGVTSEWLVDSINGITRTGVISEAWVGLILLPIVGNAAEHLTAVSVSVKDKLDLSLYGRCRRFSIQIALFVVPLLVILGWIMDKPLTLLFDPFEYNFIFIGANCEHTRRSSKLDRRLYLMCVYVIVAVAFFFYPSSAADISLGLKCN